MEKINNLFLNLELFHHLDLFNTQLATKFESTHLLIRIECIREQTLYIHTSISQRSQKPPAAFYPCAPKTVKFRCMKFRRGKIRREKFRLEEILSYGNVAVWKFQRKEIGLFAHCHPCFKLRCELISPSSLHHHRLFSPPLNISNEEKFRLKHFTTTVFLDFPTHSQWLKFSLLTL